MFIVKRIVNGCYRSTSRNCELEKNKKEMKWVGALDPFDSVTIASVCMNVFRTKFIEEEWKVKLEGRQAWIPAKMIDQKLYILWENEWIHESHLKSETVSEKEFVRMPIAKNLSQWLK